MAARFLPTLLRWRRGLWSGCCVVLLAATVSCTTPQTTASPSPEVNRGSGHPALNHPAPDGSAGGDPSPSDTHLADTDRTDGTTAANENTASHADPNLAQHLPITAKTILGGEEIFLEVAETPTQQALGLMYRDTLPDDRGMVFPMNRPRPVRFWMMNVPVALDMLFVYQGQIQYIAAEVPPCSLAPCPTYGPDNQLVDHVIELRTGRAAELGLQVGDAVEILPLD